MISQACYVQCDICGDPAEVSTEGYKVAREIAKYQGYIYVNKKDICYKCQKDKK
jgi:hypothetical protein